MAFPTVARMLLALQRMRRRERWTRPPLEAHQAHALQRLRTHAYAHSPFYQTFHRGLTHRPLQELPILTKAMLCDDFDAIVTDRAVRRTTVAAHVRALHDFDEVEEYLGRYIVAATSGTTGDPAFILYNRAEWATALASFVRRERYVGSLNGTIRRPKMAIVASSTPWHLSGRIGTTFRRSYLPMLRIDLGEPLDSIVRQLNAWQPEALATYASMAGILADEQAAGRLQIAPARVVSSAEVLTPELRQRVHAAWGNVLYNQYGASEGGTFAVECASHSGLHIYDDLVILEVVDQENRPVPPGTYGEKVLITVLFNHTQPLIRYELSDSVRLATARCPCGSAFRLIDDIQGRREEVLCFPAHDGGSVAVHPMIFYRILDATPVAGWQVVQEPDRLCLRLSGPTDRADEQTLVATVRQALVRQGVRMPPIAVEWRQEIARGATGKASRIVSHLSGQPVQPALGL